MENYKDPFLLFKQTNFSKTILWKLKVNISGYQNETENKLVTEIFKNRIFKLLYPNIYQLTDKFSRILVQLYEDGYVCWINLDGLIIEKYKLRKTENLKSEHFFIKDKVTLILNKIVSFITNVWFCPIYNFLLLFQQKLVWTYNVMRSYH